MVFSALVCFGVTACGGNKKTESSQPKTSTSVAQEKITITAAEGKTSLILGQTVQLTASTEGVTWESSKPEVATISETGLVTSVGVGSTTIKAKKEGFKEASITIKVDLETIKVTAAGQTSLLAGQTVQLSADKEGVTWASDNEAVATVSATGLVTAVKYGKAKISASKQGFNAGSIEVSVVRPEPTAVLHMEDADHYSADGLWGTSYGTTVYGPGEESPVYERTGNASDGTCIAYMDAGDKETLTFTSNKATKAEFVIMMATRTAVADVSTVFTVKLNNKEINLAGKAFEGGGDTQTFMEFSLGEVEIINGNNVLEFSFLASSPYMDDLQIYAETAATINVVRPAAKDPVVVNQTSLTICEGKTSQITSTMTGLSYRSANEAIATVSEAGLVTAVKVGETTISISKDGYKTIKLPVTVTEAEGVIAVSINEGTSEGDAITFRASQNLQAPYNYIVDAWPEGAVLTIKVNNATPKAQFNMFMRARASGGYGSTTSDDLATCMEVKINNVAVTMSGEVTGSTFTDYLLGKVNLSSGENTITIKALTTVPTMCMLRFVPAE